MTPAGTPAGTLRDGVGESTARSSTAIALSLSVVAQALYRGSTFVTLLVGARALAPSGLGELNLSLTFGYICATIVLFGFDAFYNREASVGREPRRGVYLILTWKLLLLTVAAPLPFLLMGQAVGRSALLLAGVVALSSVLAALAETPETVLVARGSAVSRVASLGIGGGSCIVLVVGAWIAVPDLPVLAFGAIFLFRDVARLGVAGSLYWRSRGRGHREQHPITAWQLVRGSAPFALMSVVVYLVARIDLTLIGFVLGPAAVGLYTPASTLVSGTAVIPTGMSPLIMRMIGRRREDGTAFATALFGLGLACGSVIALASGPICSALGPSYASSRTLLVIMSAYIPFAFLNTVLGTILFLDGKERSMPPIVLSALLVNASINISLLGVYGIEVAAWSTVTSEIVYSSLLVVALARGRDRGRSDPWPRRGPAVQNTARNFLK